MIQNGTSNAKKTDGQHLPRTDRRTNGDERCDRRPVQQVVQLPRGGLTCMCLANDHEGVDAQGSHRKTKDVKDGFDNWAQSVLQRKYNSKSFKDEERKLSENQPTDTSVEAIRIVQSWIRSCSQYSMLCGLGVTRNMNSLERT